MVFALEMVKLLSRLVHHFGPEISQQQDELLCLGILTEFLAWLQRC